MSVIRLVLAVLALAVGGIVVQDLAAPQPGVATTITLVADSPSPTLGSTPQPGVNPPGDNDGDPADWSQVWLAVVAPLTIAVLVGGSIVVYLIRRNRRRATTRH
ncbi:hypothetical protein [Kribbella sp. NPDC051620]|uniref:hypothetical protein n=1 Tax=Kribbella sp. NPDC051620 TaxID=3364120 RepID=UPI00378B2DED